MTTAELLTAMAEAAAETRCVHQDGGSAKDWSNLEEELRDVLRQREKRLLRAALAKLAELGPSEEMACAWEGSVDTLSIDYTRSDIRALLSPLLKDEPSHDPR